MKPDDSSLHVHCKWLQTDRIGAVSSQLLLLFDTGPVCHHWEWKLEGKQNLEATVRQRETRADMIGEESFVIWVADAEGTLKNKLESKRIGWHGLALEFTCKLQLRLGSFVHVTFGQHLFFV